MIGIVLDSASKRVELS